MTLEAFLKANGLKQAQFAEMVGASEGAVSRWLSGASRPSWDRLSVIEAATAGAVMPSDFMRPRPAQAAE